MARGFSREELEAFRDATVPDLVGPRLSLLFVGINPGLWTAATQTHFCHPSNRFYAAIHRAGLIDWTVATSLGMTDEQRRSFTDAGLGFSNLVSRATARASELGAAELEEGAQRLEALVVERRPKAVAIAGVTAYRTAFKVPEAHLGAQEAGIVGSELWVVPNPSGLNAHETIDTLADWYRKAAMAAGLL